MIIFGLKNAPKTFQCIMNIVLFDLLDTCIVIYLDNLLIFNRTVEEHGKHWILYLFAWYKGIRMQLW